ncbi:MAG TPA: hypothetical protein GXX75_11660 [Clostridiales bacterium]|nr:hypothetical protein [Clostridiales bacterium]
MLSQEERHKEDIEQVHYLMEWNEKKEYKKSLKKRSKNAMKMESTPKIKN